ncbi:MAG TPA: hypothetical protein PLF63_02720 [Rubrivivax sp.]|jgi:hypothetical protein|nr:hypothetical protein ISF6_3447 [Piscinibacter sakaiensis]HRD84063.1 hypothetical protein [Rubrivivax sp.]
MGAAAARAEVIELQWQDAGRFERSLTIAPGKFAEICGPLEAGQAVQWSFDADRALNFNVHYHVDKDVRYPAKKENVKRLQGDLSVDARQDYCWMWTNKTTAATKLSVTLRRK